MATPIPKNEAHFTLDEILVATRGELVHRGSVANPSVFGVGTDTRALAPGQAFVAIAGEHHDGHTLLGDAAARGASVLVVEREVAAQTEPAVVRVASTLDALGGLAAHHIGRWRALGGVRRIVCVTGSAGKTTTKLAAAALVGGLAGGTATEVLVAAGNLNNRVGVPMCALGLSAPHHTAVLELGTNHHGEIAALARICRPDIAVLTLVASAHAEGLGDIEAIAREKASVFEWLAEDATAVGNADDPRVADALRHARAARRAGYGVTAAADYRILARRLRRPAEPPPRGRLHLWSELHLRRPDRSEMVVETPLVGHAGALATAAAVAVCEALGARLEGPSVGRALAHLAQHDLGGRLDLVARGDGLWVVDDSYNANPASFASSLACLAEIAALEGRPTVLVLGEMRELGLEADAAHDALGELAAESGARLLVTVGPLARRVGARAAAHGLVVRSADDAEEAGRIATGAVRPDDVVLVKGSRGVHTEQVVEALLAGNEGTAA